MTRLYLDSSALLKRVVDEAESEHLEDRLSDEVERGSLLCTSALSTVEVSRALARLGIPDPGGATTSAALAGVHLSPLSDEVVALARRTGPALLRTLDALHLATAVLLDVDLVAAYDQRLLDAAAETGLATAEPH
ncbi:PIN domain-containing protein [Quadrisphaera granulorum]|uniref:Ribonuclease VapC n=1 Tax=Quadrisphaera granulorum TaxID=317664 RepID=A0A316ATJ7_9ACTN|nr:type II toxin-antitoxin system VapC family toxin [Quadrisphaera granulorum]PWJ53487.1 PIN domain-containing protein [Quadrisphaera granulorum]SZE96829.1 PIN domain-containing protein [Quadrisphaera granulorum]